MNKVYEIVTEKIIKLLERGVIPWQRPWKSIPPANLISGKPYRGINVILLSCTEFPSPYWLTFKQATSLGGYVRKGEKSQIVVFWKEIAGESESDRDSTTLQTLQTLNTSRPLHTPDSPKYILRYYNLFNTDQCEGISHKRLSDLTLTFTASEERKGLGEAERIASSMINPPPIIHSGSKACYIPMQDKIFMPPEPLFLTKEGYYATLFHELIHSTGHESRLARKSLLKAKHFGEEEYSQEELVAEIGAAFLSAQAGIQNERLTENSSSYIQSWLNALQGDKKMVVKAASEAQKASDYILEKLEEEVE